LQSIGFGSGGYSIESQAFVNSVQITFNFIYPRLILNGFFEYLGNYVEFFLIDTIHFVGYSENNFGISQSRAEGYGLRYGGFKQTY
jgi:hypothetical protein